MCGGAYPFRSFAKEKRNALFIATDRNRDFLLFARKQIKKEKLRNIQLLLCDVKFLPFKNKCVDISFNIGGAEYLDIREI